MMQRRSFVRNTTIASLGYGTINHFHQADARIPKTDTHVHLFDLDRFHYSWLKKDSVIYRDFNLQDYDKASETCLIRKILFMESGADPEFALEEVKAVSRLAQNEPRIHGIVAQIDLAQPLQHYDAFKQLRSIELLRGGRGKFLPQSKYYLDNLKLLADEGLTLDLLLAHDQLEEAAEFCQRSQQTTFILDHLGNPNYNQEEMTGWKNGIDRLASLPNVNCKISGMLSRIGKSWSVGDLQPFFNHVYHAFGPDRLMYGGDWPVVLLSDSYKAWSEAFEQISAYLPRVEREKIYYKNADRIYKL